MHTPKKIFIFLKFEKKNGSDHPRFFNRLWWNNALDYYVVYLRSSSRINSEVMYMNCPEGYCTHVERLCNRTQLHIVSLPTIPQ